MRGTLATLALMVWVLLALALPGPARAACAGPALVFERLADGLWRVPAATAVDANAANRGQITSLLLARERGGLWALGSGPSPAFGRALACQARQRLKLPVRWAISPWTRPEAVLGVAGLVDVQQHWAHQDVATAMAASCPHCVLRLRERLGPAAADLGADPIRVPERRLHGDQGTLGPWLWWRLPRAEGRWVTVWRWRHAPVWAAPGLLYGHGVPDGRDADMGLLQTSVHRLLALGAADGKAARWVGEQGAVQDADAPARLAAYWDALLDTVREAIRRGDNETDPPPPVPNLAPGSRAAPDAGRVDATAAAWHAMNWQRAWRQLEPEVLAEGGR